MSHHDHHEEKRQAWQQTTKFLDEIKHIGFHEYLQHHHLNIKDFFLSPTATPCAVCMDEGTAFMSLDKYCMAGSGILYPVPQEQTIGKTTEEINAIRLEIVAELYRRQGVTAISCHTGCGAGSLAAKRDNYSGNSDEYAAAWAQKLADKLGIPCRSIHAEEMVRPPAFHNARCIYFDQIGGFSPCTDGCLPCGFVINAAGHEQLDYSLVELQVALQIAFGDHGFGSQKGEQDYGFSTDSPLFVFPLSTNSVIGEQLDRWFKQNETLIDNRTIADLYSQGLIKLDSPIIVS